MTGDSEDIEVIYDAEVCVKCVASAFVEVFSVCTDVFPVAVVLFVPDDACVSDETVVRGLVLYSVAVDLLVALAVVRVELAVDLLVALADFAVVVSVAFVDLGAEVVRLVTEPVSEMRFAVVVNLGAVVVFAVVVLVVPEDDFVE